MATKKWGDRKDGKLLRGLDSMHCLMPLMYPNRCDNEAFIMTKVDLTRTDEYLKRRNAENPEYKYNLFQLAVTAILKTIMLRPIMNRFIVNGKTYERNVISAAFTVKKIFKDDGAEALARLEAHEDDTLDSIHDAIYRQVSITRSERKDDTTEQLDLVERLPFKTLVGVGARFLDRHGWMPSSITDVDPYYCSVVLSNLGSLKLDAGYHHLTNWGTTSVFCAIGYIKERPFTDDEGNTEMRLSVELGLTIDERLADGYYYAKSVRLFKTLLENPELLEKPLKEEVDY